MKFIWLQFVLSYQKMILGLNRKKSYTTQLKSTYSIRNKLHTEGSFYTFNICLVCELPVYHQKEKSKGTIKLKFLINIKTPKLNNKTAAGFKKQSGRCD